MSGKGTRRESSRQSTVIYSPSRSPVLTLPPQLTLARQLGSFGGGYYIIISEVEFELVQRGANKESGRSLHSTPFPPLPLNAPQRPTRQQQAHSHSHSTPSLRFRTADVPRSDGGTVLRVTKKLRAAGARLEEIQGSRSLAYDNPAERGPFESNASRRDRRVGNGLDEMEKEELGRFGADFCWEEMRLEREA